MTLNFLLRSLKRRCATIIYFLLCFFIIGVLYAFMYNKPLYKSSAQFQSFTNSSDTNSKVVSVMRDSTDIYDIVSNNLNENGVFHSNRKNITASEITKGISVSYTSNTSTILVSFFNSDETIVDTVLNEFMVVAQNIVVNKVNGFDGNIDKLNIISNSSNPVNTAKSNVMIVGLFTAIGVIIGVVLAIWSEVKNNTIYELSDIKELGSNVFPIYYKVGGSKNEK